MKADLYINKYFATHDLGLAAALITASYPIDHLDKTDPSRINFVFRREEGMDEIIQLYWNNSLKLSLLAFFNNIKILKNRIHSG